MRTGQSRLFFRRQYTAPLGSAAARRGHTRTLLVQTTGMAEPRRLRSGAVVGEPEEDVPPPAADVDRLVEAVVARLAASGLVAGALESSVKEEDAVPDVTEDSPSPGQRKLWISELRRQLEMSANFGVREKEEVRGLLLIGEGAGPPPDQVSWFWGRVRLFLVVAHEGWAAAVRDARSHDMDRLGIRLSPAAAQPAAPAPPLPPQPPSVPAPAARWRGRPSRPSGLRAPPRGAAPTSAPRRTC